MKSIRIQRKANKEQRAVFKNKGKEGLGRHGKRDIQELKQINTAKKLVANRQKQTTKINN
jgi:hypothetical protein